MTIADYFSEGLEQWSSVHGTRRSIKVLYETIDLIMFYQTMAPGEELRPEQHDVEEIIYRIEGTTEHQVGSTTCRVTAGMRVYIPAFTTHSCKVVDDVPVKQIVVLSRNAISGRFHLFEE